jgi:hypothetical protein
VRPWRSCGDSIGIEGIDWIAGIAGIEKIATGSQRGSLKIAIEQQAILSIPLRSLEIPPGDSVAIFSIPVDHIAIPSILSILLRSFLAIPCRSCRRSRGDPVPVLWRSCRSCVETFDDPVDPLRRSFGHPVDA